MHNTLVMRMLFLVLKYLVNDLISSLPPFMSNYWIINDASRCKHQFNVAASHIFNRNTASGFIYQNAFYFRSLGIAVR